MKVLPERVVREERVPGDVPLYAHPDWQRRFPWLVQGTTGRDLDLRLFGDAPVGELLQRWRLLREATSCTRAVHARQVHGAKVLMHESGAPGLFIGEGADGHATSADGVLLTVSVADCVPVFLVDPEQRVVAALHAGWRGTAAGILRAGVRALQTTYGCSQPSLWLHLGPAICGNCYEVGPEVHVALGLPAPESNQPVDVRALLREQALALGLEDERISTSRFCTRCGDGAGDVPFFSHRSGCVERQMGLIGILTNR